MTIIKSLSQEFFCDASSYQYINGNDYRYAVYSVSRRGYPVAMIKKTNGVVIGIRGNSGNRFDKLADIEKVDVGTLVTAMVHANYVDSLPTTEEQRAAAMLCD